MYVWKFLHIACMFGAFSIGVGGGLMVDHVVRTGDVAAIRRVVPAWDRLGNLVAAPLFLLGLAFGAVTAVVGDFGLTAPWLVMAYVLVAALLVHGYAVYDPQLKRLKAAVAAAPATDPSPELTALLISPRTRFAFRVEVLLWLAVIVVMVVKPFS